MLKNIKSYYELNFYERQGTRYSMNMFKNMNNTLFIFYTMNFINYYKFHYNYFDKMIFIIKYKQFSTGFLQEKQHVEYYMIPFIKLKL